MAEFLQITTVVGSRAEADRLAERLVNDWLAACVQVAGPISSVYRWQGNVERGEEWTLLIKTTSEHWAAVERAIRFDHSYDVPEIIATPIVVGHAPYLEWLRKQLVPPPVSQ